MIIGGYVITDKRDKPVLLGHRQTAKVYERRVDGADAARSLTAHGSPVPGSPVAAGLMPLHLAGASLMIGSGDDGWIIIYSSGSPHYGFRRNIIIYSTEAMAAEIADRINAQRLDGIAAGKIEPLRAVPVTLRIGKRV